VKGEDVQPERRILRDGAAKAGGFVLRDAGRLSEKQDRGRVSEKRDAGSVSEKGAQDAAGEGAPPARRRVVEQNSDEGSATIWILGIGVALFLISTMFAAAGSVLVAHRRAETAADLGALAGATHAIEGATTACAAAGAIVRANGGSLVACGLDALDVIVTAEVNAPPPWGTVRASARAGPARSP
jgi:secretion/DNA translocation related TadE-like protein